MRGAIGAAVLILVTGFAAGGPWVGQAEARCDTSGNCFPEPDPDEDSEICLYEATYQGVTILMECSVEVEDDSEMEEASMLAAVHRSKVSASAFVSVSINITRNDWHDEENNYTLHFDPDARHIAWDVHPRFNGSFAEGQPDSQHHEARFQVNATAPSGPVVVHFVYWDDTDPGIRRAALAINVEERRDDGRAPGVTALVALTAILGVGLLLGCRPGTKPR